MCAEEFASFLESTKKAPIDEKLNAFGDIIEKIMQIVLKIPDLVDITIQDVNSQISNLQSQIGGMNQEITALKARPVAVAGPATSGAPGAPPPPPGPGPKPAPARSASPVSLRGAIMGELKSLFNKRKSASGG